MKVVLDTMLWVSYCTRREGYRHRLVERARRQGVRLFVSDYILDELAKVLDEDLHESRRFIHLARRAITRRAQCVDLPVVRHYVHADPQDDAIVQTALVGKVDYLVTADAALLTLAQVHDVRILAPADWEALLPPEA